jgi:hypothetical protein
MKNVVVLLSLLASPAFAYSVQSYTGEGCTGNRVFNNDNRQANTEAFQSEFSWQSDGNAGNIPRSIQFKMDAGKTGK